MIGLASNFATSADFDSATKTIKSETSVDDVLKTKQSTYESNDYFKIQQESTGKAATITKELQTALSSTFINSANLASSFNTDSDGLIYYTNASSVKVYDLTTSTTFTADVSSSIPANPTPLTDHAYYDYFVRFHGI